MPLEFNVSGLVQAPASPFVVRFPGWDDVVHYGASCWMTQGQYWANRKAREAELAKSPTPQLVADFAKIGQSIDDLQDAMVTLSVLGRVLVKTTGRAIPGLGWVATAADVLNTLNIFYPPNALSVGRWMSTKSKKRATADASRLSGGTYRRRLLDTRKTGRLGLGYGEVLQVLQTTDLLLGVGLSLGPIFGGATDTLLGIARGAEFSVPGIEEVLFGCRSSAALARLDQFLGFPGSAALPLTLAGPIGMALGAFGVGAKSFTSATYADGRIRIMFPGILPWADLVLGLPPGTAEQEVAKILTPYVGPAQAGVAAVLHGFGAAYNFLSQAVTQFTRAASELWSVAADVGWEMTAEMAVGQALLTEVLRPAMQASGWGDIAAAAAARPWWGGALPSVPAAAEMLVGDVSVALREQVALARQTWLSSVPAGVMRDFCSGLLCSVVDDLVEALEGPDVPIAEDSGELWRGAVGMQERELVWAYNHGDVDGLAYVEGSAALTPPAGEGYADVSEQLGLFNSLWPGEFYGW